MLPKDELPPIPTAAERLRAFLGRSAAPIFLLIVMGLIAYALYAEASGSYRWQWHRVWRYIGRTGADGFRPGPLLQGLAVTLELSAASLLLAVAAGSLTALARVSRSPEARLLASLYLEAIRNTPLLLQLYLVYFAAAPVFGLTPFSSAVIALGLFEGAYLSEIFRAGLLSVPPSQWEAAYSLGLGTAQALRYVAAPQAFRSTLPPFVSQVVSLIKDTSLVSAIAVQDMAMRARDVISDTFLTFEIWLIVALIYLVLTSLTDAAAVFLDRRRTASA